MQPYEGIQGLNMDFAEHIDSLHMWNLDMRVQQLVEHTCLYQFAKSIPKIKQRGGQFFGLVVRRYRDGAFHIRDKRLYIGLEDVLMITGLPIVGDMIVPSELDCAEVAGEVLRIEVKKNIRTSYLREMFEIVPADVQGDGLKKYATAYLLFLIGCVVFSGFTKLNVPTAFILLVKDLDKANDYAWGAGLLAYTHHNLAAVKVDSANFVFNGNDIFLKVFLLIHLPSLASFFDITEENFPKSFPLLGEWCNAMKINNMNSKKKYHSVNDQMRVVFQPYREVVVPIDRRRELLVCHIDTYVCCVDKIWRINKEDLVQQVDLNSIEPLGFDMSEVEDMPLHMQKTRKSSFTQDWNAHYEPQLKRWIRFMTEFKKGIQVED